MPNGGYPRHLITPVSDSGIEIHLTRWHISARRRHENGFYEFGDLNEVQISAVLYHLLYWMGFDDEKTMSSIRNSLSRHGFEVRPHFNKNGCYYDY